MNSVAFVGSFPVADFRLAPPGRPEIAFVGRSNAGKSSLLNRLAGRRALARTGRTPGQTRACNVFNVGNRFWYVDLPGYGYAHGSRAQRLGWSKLIRDYLVTGRPAGAVWLLDLRREPSPEDLAMARLLAEHSVATLVTLTKADKVPQGHRQGRLEAILEGIGVNTPSQQCVVTSARTGEGIPMLRAAIERLVSGGAGGR